MSIHSIQDPSNQIDEIFNADQLYGTAAVMEKLDLGKTAFRELIASGSLPFIRISERTRKFRGSTLNRLFQEQTGV